MQQIYLIRHLSPQIGNPSCHYIQAESLLEHYNHTESLCIEEINIAPKLPHLPIYCSPLPRARLTAEYLFPNANITLDSHLKEFNLTIVPMKWLRCRFQHWLVLSRLLWFIGVHQCGNTVRQEKQRINHFIQQHLKQDSIIVAHGFVLREIKKSLMKQGFKAKRLAKSGCFCIDRLAK